MKNDHTSTKTRIRHSRRILITSKSSATNLNQLAHRCHIWQEHPASRQAQVTFDALAQIRTALLGERQVV